jgi:signal transduction histidine kinase
MGQQRQQVRLGEPALKPLASRGAVFQFVVAMLLVSVIPLLVLLGLLLPGPLHRSLDAQNIWTLTFVVLSLVALGYAILVKYPVNTIRLRRYLAQLARDELPDEIQLLTGEEDLSSIEEYMTRIVITTANRIRLIEEQSERLVEIERQRVMIESLGAACHHLGQPATVITAYLSLMEKEDVAPDVGEMIAQCKEAARLISDILSKLPKVAEYRTEPYLEGGDGNAAHSRILQI